MSAELTVVERSTNRMVLAKASGQKTVWNFVTPTNWQVGDGVIMQINRSPHDLNWVNGQLVVVRPPEPPNGWEREFYSLYNTRTRDRIKVDFDSVEGFETLPR
jgi:hypothetical protein